MAELNVTYQKQIQEKAYRPHLFGGFPAGELLHLWWVGKRLGHQLPPGLCRLAGLAGLGDALQPAACDSILTS